MAELVIRNPGPNIIQAIRVVRELTGCGLKDAKECAEGRPLFVGNPTQDARDNFHVKLREVGVVLAEILPLLPPNVALAARERVREAQKPAPKSWHERLLEEDET